MSDQYTFLLNEKCRQCSVTCLCRSCGHELSENARRRQAIRNGELKKGEDGLKRLYLGFKKEESIEDAD